MRTVFKYLWKILLFYWTNRKWVNDLIRKVISYAKVGYQKLRNKNKSGADNQNSDIKKETDSFGGKILQDNNQNKTEKMAEQEELGIDLIKKAIKTLFNTGEEIYEAKKNDGEISKLELLGLGDNIIAIGSQAMKVGQVIDQVKDVDSDEAKELAAYIVNLGFASGDVQFILTHSFAYIQAQFDAYSEHLEPIIEKIKEMRKK